MDKLLINKKILIVSNNALSETNNNGKTLLSLVRGYPKENISQLYFSDETPSFINCNNFYKITDTDIIKKNFGSEVSQSTEKLKQSEKKSSSKLRSLIKNYEFFRLGREALWKYVSFDKDNLIKWVEKQNPDVIFFCAGDSLFAYDITDLLVRYFETKLVVYITDDYILPRVNLSIFWWMRRNLILDKMQSLIPSSDLFVVISNKMRAEYKKIFHKESVVFLNTPTEVEYKLEQLDNERVELIYAGGFHYNRWKVLNKIAVAIEFYNSQNPAKKAFLSIYSNSEPNKHILKKINIEGSSEFYGQLNETELSHKLNESDILVHAEAFDRKSKHSTMLSVSTKIPEYLVLSKTILAVGPVEIASIDYLSNRKNVFMITKDKDIKAQVFKLLKCKAKDKSYKAHCLSSHFDDKEINNIKDIMSYIFNSSFA